MSKILIATHNPGKITEYKEIFGSLPYELLMLDDLSIKEEPEENEKTFEANAVKKAEFYSGLTDLPVLAEDSGLEIDYLKGEPGVFSRRWPTAAEAMAGKPGSKKTDEELIQITLDKLKGVPLEKRGAQFRVVIAFKKSPKSGILTAEGTLRGIILEKPAAAIVPGFPFRSLFYVPEIKKVIGELTMEEESRFAHRRQAIKKLVAMNAL